MFAVRARTLIVIYNRGRAPVRRDANTPGLMKLANESPRVYIITLPRYPWPKRPDNEAG